MIKVSKFRNLTFEKKKYKCSVGKYGLTRKKKEGDCKTPIGTFSIVKCLYRPDRIKKPDTNIPCKKIYKNSAWCDDTKSKYYNKMIKVPSKFQYEKLFRKDDCYNIILVLNYNMSPIIKGKGSAIFIHIAKKNYKPTRGCVAIKMQNLFEILKKINKSSKVIIG